jgi:hypothetical protein
VQFFPRFHFLSYPVFSPIPVSFGCSIHIH